MQGYENPLLLKNIMDVKYWFINWHSIIFFKFKNNFQ